MTKKEIERIKQHLLGNGELDDPYEESLAKLIKHTEDLWRKNAELKREVEAWKKGAEEMLAMIINERLLSDAENAECEKETK